MDILPLSALNQSTSFDCGFQGIEAQRPSDPENNTLVGGHTSANPSSSLYGTPATHFSASTSYGKWSESIELPSEHKIKTLLGKFPLKPAPHSMVHPPLILVRLLHMVSRLKAIERPSNLPNDILLEGHTSVSASPSFYGTPATHFSASSHSKYSKSVSGF